MGPKEVPLAKSANETKTNPPTSASTTSRQGQAPGQAPSAQGMTNKTKKDHEPSLVSISGQKSTGKVCQDGDDNVTAISWKKSTETQTNPSHRQPVAKWYHRLSIHGVFGWMINILRRLTAFPMVSSASIYFDEDERYSPTGERIPDLNDDQEHFLPPEQVEIAANYDKATMQLFEAILKYRRESKCAKENYHTVKIDMSKFPEWTDAIIDRLRTTFQVFDFSGDGFVDFEELCTILEEFGDTTEMELRKKYFDDVDSGGGLLGFLDFIKLIYTVTVQTPKEPGAEELAQSFHSIDRNMARIRSLDVVQQLQAGLF